MNIGNIYLKRLPRAPYAIKSHLEFDYLEQNEKIIYEKWKKDRCEIIKRNSDMVFNKNFKKNYKEKIASMQFTCGHARDPLGILFKEFGFGLKRYVQQKSQIKILQIGCGPGDGYTNGPNLNRILRELGVNTMNLDILDVQDYYPDRNFRRGSWLEIEKYFKEETFDAIFMDNMNPNISDDIVKFCKTSSVNVAYQNLIIKTMSRLRRRGGIFFISGIDCGSFSIPEHVNDIIDNSNIQNSSLFGWGGQGIQIYKKEF